MKNLRLNFFLSLGLLFFAMPLPGVSVNQEELTERSNWVVARFEGRQPAPRTDPALLVIGNYGPVIKNTRAGKPLRIGGEGFHPRAALPCAQQGGRPFARRR